MIKYFSNNFPVINLYKKPKIRSEVVTQMIFGESFSILRKDKKWLKIKIKEDAYKGYIKNKHFPQLIKPTHKIKVLKAKIYKFPNSKIKINNLPFCAKIKVTQSKGKYLKFCGGWINRKDVKLISFKNKDPFKNISIFKNIKYKWGGKSYKGVDCSGLIQIFLNFNNKFCPRDAKDQFNFFKKNISLFKIKKNDLIYWKGHVALAISDKKLIHAYGPMKKTVIMNINQTIGRIEKTAKLKIIGIKRL